MLFDKVLEFLADWLSRSGDHTFWSWVITIMYFITAVMAFVYLRKIRLSQIPDDRQKLFLWTGIFIFLLLMGINKQLDIQTLILMSMRYVMWRFRLWHYWRTFHFLMFYGLGSLFLISGILMTVKSGKAMLKSLAAVAGVLVVMLFVFMRANYIFMQHIHALELAGIGLIFIDLVIKMIFERRRNSSPVQEKI